MKILLAIYVLFLAGSLQAQKDLAIDNFRLWHFKRFHVMQNEAMTYKLKGSTHKQTHVIMDMEDSVLFIETGEAIRLDQIKKVIFDRSNFLTRMVSSFFRVAGIGYIALDAINSAGNAEPHIFKERVLVAGAVLFAVGEVIHIANKKRIRIGRHGTLKIIDLSLK